MTTENRRVATYLPSHLHEALERFKISRSIESDSQALITILSEFLDVPKEIQTVSSARLEILEASVKAQEEKLEKLLNRLGQKFAEIEQQISDKGFDANQRGSSTLPIIRQHELFDKASNSTDLNI